RWLALTVVGQYPERETPLQALRARLRRVRHAPPGERLERLRGYAFTARAWQPQRVYEDLAGAEVGIIPVDMRPDPLPGRQVSYWQVKSENRLTLKMAAGLAVVASPVPSYLDIIEQGVNGYIAHSRADWLAALDALRDPQHRHSVGAAARASVLQRYSIDEQARRLIAVFDGLRGTSQPAGDAALLRMP
nr:glycosyltransferase [Plasticicumulans sp.]